MRKNISFLVVTLTWIALLAGCNPRSTTDPAKPPTITPFSNITQESSLSDPNAATQMPTTMIPDERPMHFYVANLITPPKYLYRAFLQNPHEMAFGPDGLLYIADWLGRHIVRVSPDGTMDAIETWRDPNFLGGGPRCVAFSPDGRLYSCDHGHIYRFRTDLTIESDLPLPEGTFIGSIVFSPEGELYYTDRNAGVVMRWNTDGPPDTIASGIQSAEKMVYGLDGTLYVSQMSMGQVVKVNIATGQVEVFFSSELGDDPLFLTEDVQGNIWIYGTEALKSVSPEGIEQPYEVENFFYKAPPAGIAFDSQGNLWLGSYQDMLWKLERTNPEESTPNFKANMIYPGLFIISMDVGPSGEIYATEQHSSSLLRFDQEGQQETLVSGLPFGNAAVAVDHAGNVYLGLPDNRIVRLETDGTLSHYASITTRSMVFGEDGNLYVVNGDSSSGALIRVTGQEEYTTIATSIAGISLENVEAHVKRAPGGLYFVTEQTCNLFFVDFEGQGRLIKSDISTSGGCKPIAVTSTPDGEVFFIAQNPYILLRIDEQGNLTEYAYSILGDPWAMTVSPDGQWLYVAEAGAIDKIPITPFNP